MFHLAYNGNINPATNFKLFKFNNSLVEETSGNTEWCTQQGTVNFVASGTLGIPTFRGDYWAQSSNANNLNYLKWNPGLMPRNYGTLECVVVATGSQTVKQMGVSAYDGGTRYFEPAKSVLNSQQAYLINFADSAGPGGQPLGPPNRLYFVSCYSPTKATQKVYTLDSANNFTLRDTISTTAFGKTVPDLRTITLNTHLFSMKSFNGLDNHAGWMNYVKFSNTYSETPTYAGQDI